MYQLLLFDMKKKILSKTNFVQVLGNGELSNKITIEATKFTKTALAKLQKSGSTAKEI